MVRVKCKGCGRVLFDSETMEQNYVVEWELDVKLEVEGQKLDLKRIGVCVNCGHKFDVKKLEEMFGIERNLWDEVMGDG